MSFKEPYDLAMYFVRYQEFYESPSPQYRGKKFALLDFMRWYSFKFGKGVFTYPEDWAGFNIPGDIIKQIWDLGIDDRNLYDYEMLQVYRECQEKAKGNFYLIGVSASKEEAITLKHEIAHGFFYTTPSYKKEMKKLVKELAPELRTRMNEELLDLGYTPKVYVDEIQAYMSTGLPMSSDGTELYAKLEAAQKPFIKLYNQYYKEK
jgi:hypothetical protein